MTFNLTRLAIPDIVAEVARGAVEATERAAAADGFLSATVAPNGASKSDAQVAGTVVPTAVSGPHIRLIEVHAADKESPVLSASYLRLLTPDGRRELFRDVSFSIAQGEHVLILGPSGSGEMVANQLGAMLH